MPTICFASSKGGVGKSTAACILAAEISRAQTDVTIVDADPNRPFARWKEKTGGLLKKKGRGKISVESDITQDNILDVIDAAARSDPFVIVDLEGTANMLVNYAVSRADLVLVPLQDSELDATEAAKAVKLVRQAEKGFDRKIPFSLFFTKTSAVIRTKSLAAYYEEFGGRGIPCLGVELFDRRAFRTIFDLGGTIYDLTEDEIPAKTAAAASENAGAFAKEVIAKIKPKQRRAA